MEIVTIRIMQVGIVIILTHHPDGMHEFNTITSMNIKLILHISSYCIVVLSSLLLTSCSGDRKGNMVVSNEIFEISDFEPVSNFNADSSGVVHLFIDYTGSMQNGFIIPSRTQSANGYFAVKFKIRNKSNTTQDFGYKIFYNN